MTITTRHLIEYSFIWTLTWPDNAEVLRAAVLFSIAGIWLACLCCCPQSMAAPQRPLLCTPSSSHMEHQACWTCMPVRWSHDNSARHFSFIPSSRPGFFIELSLSFPQSALSSLKGLPLALNREKEREVWGLLRNYLEFSFTSVFFSPSLKTTADMNFEVA